MQVVKQIFIGLIVLWFGLLVLMPKSKLYYKLEETLKSQDIKINEESIDEGLFTLKLKNLTIYAKGIEIAKLKELTLFTTLFYNTVIFKELVLDDLAASQAFKKINEATITHSVVSPLITTVDINGSMGIVEGSVSLLEQYIDLDFIEVKDIKAIKQYLKKDAEGWHYETSF